MAIPRLGAHMSIAGGLSKALLRGKEAGCDTIQLFTRNSNQWRAKPLTPQDIDAFRQAQKTTGITPLIAHDIYLINLASPKPQLRHLSKAAFLEEIKRAEVLGIDYLVFHPGSHMGAGVDEGLGRIAKAINELLEKTPEFNVQLLIETTAGQGTQLGRTFQELASLLSYIKQVKRVGICLDTCHIFAAGYDIANLLGYKRMRDDFSRIIGLDKLKAIHLNDSKSKLASRVDRHAHIGLGHLGLSTFSRLLNDPLFNSVPMVLETPKEKNDAGKDMDVVNLGILRGLINPKG